MTAGSHPSPDCTETVVASHAAASARSSLLACVILNCRRVVTELACFVFVLAPAGFPRNATSRANAAISSLSSSSELSCSSLLLSPPLVTCARTTCVTRVSSLRNEVGTPAGTSADCCCGFASAAAAFTVAAELLSAPATRGALTCRRRPGESVSAGSSNELRRRLSWAVEPNLRVGSECETVVCLSIGESEVVPAGGRVTVPETASAATGWLAAGISSCALCFFRKDSRNLSLPGTSGTS